MQKGSGNRGTIKSARLLLHGSKDIPHHVSQGKGHRVYNNEYNKVKDERDVRYQIYSNRSNVIKFTKSILQRTL